MKLYQDAAHRRLTSNTLTATLLRARWAALVPSRKVAPPSKTAHLIPVAHKAINSVSMRPHHAPVFAGRNVTANTTHCRNSP